MRLLRPLPRVVTRPLAIAAVLAWVVTMGVLVNRSYLQASPGNLATDLARYGPTAVWRGVYYRGEKIGFTVSQTTRTEHGYELQEDGRLQMSLLGATTMAAIRTSARVDQQFVLQSFEFSLDPGTGAVGVRGEVQGTGEGGHALALSITSGGVTRTEVRQLPEAPVLTLNLARRLAGTGLKAGARHRFMVLDPATLSNAPVDVSVGERSLVRAGDSRVPAFRVDMAFRGLRTTSWVTDTGEVMREESPLGLVSERESPGRAQGLAISGRVRADLLAASAVVPTMTRVIDDGRDVRRMRIQLDRVDVSGFELEGVGQHAIGNVVELQDVRTLRGDAPDPAAARYLEPEPLIESDAPEIHAEARKAVGGAASPRLRAERLTRYVSALLEKKPTVSIPSAREVLRTKVGDCNEHTALYVAMARAAGIPARIAVGLVYLRGAFYYHAWPEVYLEETPGRALWLPVDPTLNQFPADATHLRLLRGGLERQAAILPLIGTMRMTVMDVDVAPESERILVGRELAQ